MKKILYILLIISVFGCTSNDESPVNDEFLNQVLGMYQLRAAYTDIPVDLNYDGDANTNLLDEVEYCNMSKHLESYKGRFSYTNHPEASIDIPFSKYLMETESYSNCLMNQWIFYEIDVNSENNTVSLIHNDWEDDYIAQFNAELIEMYWEDGVAYFTIKKQFYNSNEKWQEVMLYMEFEKYSDQW